MISLRVLLLTTLLLGATSVVKAQVNGIPVIGEGEGFEVDLEPFAIENEITRNYSDGNLKNYLGVGMRELLPNLLGVLLFPQEQEYYTGQAIFRGPPFRTNHEVFLAQESALETFQGTFVNVNILNSDSSESENYPDENGEQQHQGAEHPYYPQNPHSPQLYPNEAPDNWEYDEPVTLSSEEQQEQLDDQKDTVIHGAAIAVGCFLGVIAICLLLAASWFHRHYRCIPRPRSHGIKKAQVEEILKMYKGKDKHSDCGSNNGRRDEEDDDEDDDDEDEEEVIDLYEDEPKPMSRHRRVRSTLPNCCGDGHTNADATSPGHRRWNSIGVPAAEGVGKTPKRPSMIDLLAMMDDE